MTDDLKFQDRLSFRYEKDTYRRRIAGKEVIVHCHHYNARLQGTIEGVEHINGKEIMRSSAEIVFSEFLLNLFKPEDLEVDKLKLAELLYSNLGYGKLDFSNIDEAIVTASSSHFVEGWQAGFQQRSDAVCTFTEGYIQGAIYAIYGQLAHATEKHCKISGVEYCLFELDYNRTTPVGKNIKSTIEFKPKENKNLNSSSNIDQEKIIDALVEMPIYGGNDGLIPAFNVYLANTPADFYNLVCIQFVEEMKKINMFNAAKKLLIYCGEICGLYTFRGIMNSLEWESLIAPMVIEPKDNLFGIIAVSNGLGWGNWHIEDIDPGKRMVISSLNGYEALGVREYRNKMESPHCFMLTGVAAGIMELIYADGTMEDRFGTFHSKEYLCISCQDDWCSFEVTIL